VCVCVCVHGSLVFHTYSQNDAYCDTVDEHLGWEINVWEDPLPQELDMIAESRGGPHGPAGATVWIRRKEANYTNLYLPAHCSMKLYSTDTCDWNLIFVVNCCCNLENVFQLNFYMQ